MCISRIYCEDKQTFLQDFADDGETAAGGRLLHLMEVSVAATLVVLLTSVTLPDKTELRWE